MADTGGRRLGFIIAAAGLVCAGVGAYLWLRVMPPEPKPVPPHELPPSPEPKPAPNLTPPPPKMALGDFLAEADFVAALQKTGALYIVVAVSDPDSEASLAQTRDLLPLVAAWHGRHTAVIGITVGQTEVDAARFIRQSGQPQQFAVYRAPWFAAKYNLTATPTLYLFDRDGHPLYKASEGTAPVLSQIKARVDELLAQSADPEINPSAAGDPVAQEDRWTKQQIAEGVKLLPGIAAALKPVTDDQPGAGDTVEQLTARYRPALQKLGARYAWAYKGWAGEPDPHWAKVSLTDDPVTRFGPAGFFVGRALVVDQVDGRAVHAELQVYFSQPDLAPLLFIQFDPAQPADAPVAAQLQLRTQIWLQIDPPPQLLIDYWQRPKP